MKRVRHSVDLAAMAGDEIFLAHATTTEPPMTSSTASATTTRR